MTVDAKNPVLALEKTMAIIETLKTIDRAGITEIAERTGFGKSLVHGHLSTLEEEGYVVEEDSEYRLGLKFLEIGGHIKYHHDLYQFGTEEIDALAEDTGELANMMTEEHGIGVDLYRAQGRRSVEPNAPEGRRSHLHFTALGKSILAHMPRERVEEIVDYYGLPQRTSNTITDRHELMKELESTRERGYAIDNEERTEGLRCIATVVKDRDGDVLGAISVSGPASRMKGELFEEEIPDRIEKAKNMIELNIQYA